MFFQNIPKEIRAREVNKQSWDSNEYTFRLTGTYGAYWRNATVKGKTWIFSAKILELILIIL